MLYTLTIWGTFMLVFKCLRPSYSESSEPSEQESWKCVLAMKATLLERANAEEKKQYNEELSAIECAETTSHEKVLREVRAFLGVEEDAVPAGLAVHNNDTHKTNVTYGAMSLVADLGLSKFLYEVLVVVLYYHPLQLRGSCPVFTKPSGKVINGITCLRVLFLKFKIASYLFIVLLFSFFRVDAHTISMALCFFFQTFFGNEALTPKYLRAVTPLSNKLA